MVQGRGINAPLNETGRIQARRTYEHLRNIKFDRIYTSNLIRTHQTVADFKKDGYELIPLEGFDEISWGSMEGIKASNEEKNLYAQTVSDWQRGDLHKTVGNGESPIQVMNRQQEAMATVLANGGENILVCMHGRAMRILLAWLLNYPLKFMDGFPHKNCAYYQVRYLGGQYLIEKFNYTGHL